MKITIILIILFILPLFADSHIENDIQGSIGYRIGSVDGYKLLKQYGKSSLYQIQSQELDDDRPIKVAKLVGSHYEVGYAYAALLGPNVVQNFHTFLHAEFKQEWQILVLLTFLSWQYDSYVSEQIPAEFKQELKGLQKGGSKEHGIHNLRSIFQQTLVVSSYPGDFTNDIVYALLDQFMRDYLKIHNQKLLNIIEDKVFEVVKLIKHFINKKRIHCSFFAAWGKRTEGGKLITMRNLDWQANTGMNKNKLLFIWKIDNTIPHLTLGFPGILGALTGMSKAGITVHEAGLDSIRETQLGFQWTLRLRYIMMYAENLDEAKQIWKQTNNTLGMNHMIASARDVVTRQPAFVVETMRNYTAWFKDNDPREDGTVFVDPKTKKQYIAGFAMEEVVFRTNHAYDPFINKYRTFLPSVDTSTMIRYMVLKDGFNFYHEKEQKIGDHEAVNITAAAANKGGSNPYLCPGPKDNGTNVISAVYVPAEQKMYMAFEYGGGQTYRTACCGVYVQINLNEWWS